MPAVAGIGISFRYDLAGWNFLSFFRAPVIGAPPPTGAPPFLDIFPGTIVPQPNPNACPTLLVTWQTYFLTVPAVLVRADQYRLAPGTVALVQSGPCQWQGTVGIQRDTLPFTAFTVGVTLDVLPDATARLTYSAMPLLWPLQRPVYTSQPGWGGNTAVGLIGTGPLSPCIFPNAFTLAPPPPT